MTGNGLEFLRSPSPYRSDPNRRRNNLGMEIQSLGLTGIAFCVNSDHCSIFLLGHASVVSTETCPRRNWICSNSPLFTWQSFAHVLRTCRMRHVFVPISRTIYRYQHGLGELQSLPEDLRCDDCS